MPYHSPLYREVAKFTDIDSTVIFEDTLGATEGYIREFNANIKWDIPLTDNYKYKYLKNYAINRESGFFSRINPSIVHEIIFGGYDVIIIHGYSTLSDWMALFTALLCGKKLIIKGEATLRGNETQTSFLSLLKRVILSILFKKVNAIMYSCSGNRDFFSYFGTHKSKMFFLPCAVDNDYLQLQRKRYQKDTLMIKSNLGISESDFVIVFVGRMTKRKRPIDIAKVINKLSYNDIVAIFVGDGPERKEVEKYCEEYGVKALFTGFKNQSELAAFYSIADIFVLTSDYDPSPKAINEAMNFALPIIATRVVGTAPDLLKEGENSYIIETGDIETLAEKIRILYNDKLKLRDMGMRSLEIVREWNAQRGALAIRDSLSFVMGFKF